MSENLPLPEENPKEVLDPNTLAKIDIKKPKPGSKNTEDDQLIRNEDSLLSCTRILLRHFGHRKSGAAVRDAV